MVTVLGTSRQTARRDHLCSSCGHKITPRQQYFRARCVDGGEAWVWKAHLHCLRAGEILADHGIEGEDGAMINVIDMDSEDRALVARVDLVVARAIWPNTPLPLGTVERKQP